MSVQQQDAKEDKSNTIKESQAKPKADVKQEQLLEKNHKKRPHEDGKADTDNGDQLKDNDLEHDVVTKKKPHLDKLSDPLVSDTKEDTSKQPKIAFGASSPFSSGFGLSTTGQKPFGSFGSFGTVQSPNAFLQTSSSEFNSNNDGAVNSSKTETKTFPSFGASMSFGAGFGVLKKSEEDGAESKNKTEEESVKEEDKKEEGNTQETTKEKKEDDKEDSKSSTKEVSIKPSEAQLTAQEVKSGEEDDIIKFQSNAKLYELIDIKEGWKERGVGPLHVNESKESGKSRIIMRNKALLNVILNLPLIKGFQVHKGFPGSVQGDKFIRIVAVNENQKPVQYAIKVGRVESIDELVECINAALQK